MVSRAEYPEVRTREEFNRPGVYVLLGPAEKSGFDSKIYVGEADMARKRLDSHVKHKEFWTDLILFTSRDKHLNKAHVKYLESRLIDIARLARKVEVENANAPKLPALSEPEIADVESFLADMLLIYPVLGINAFDSVKLKDSKSPKLYFKMKEAEAEGREMPEGFVVLAGARARDQVLKALAPARRELRQKLVAQGVLALENGQLRLRQDYVFNSPTMAASVIGGKDYGGLKRWKTADGRTLRQLQEAALAKSDNK